VLRVAPGLELDFGSSPIPEAIVVVEQGEAELECRSGTRRRFGRGSMIPITRLPLAHLRSVGSGPLVLVAVSRASLPTRHVKIPDPDGNAIAFAEPPDAANSP
jgi:hypothetical protein